MKNVSLWTWLLCCTLLAAAALWYPKWAKPHTEATISWDVSGYYWYLPAYLIYQDPGEMAFKDSILTKYMPTWDLYQAFPHGDVYVMKYSLGLALQYLPGFAAGHLWALGSPYPADGFSFPYQFALHWWSLLVAFWGLWLTRLNLRRFFSDGVTAVTLLLIGLGTNYFNYASIDAALSHNYLFTLYALLIYLSIRWHERPGRGRALLIGAVVGLAALTRPTDIIALLIPLLWAWRGWKEQWRFLARHWDHLLLAAVAGGAIGALQLVYWKSVSGDWIVYSYQDQGFSFLSPHLYEVFFTYKKGWLVYTPIMALALLGIPFLWRRQGLFGAVLIFFAVNAWIVSAWDVWWYGGSFGQRAMVQSYAMMALPLAAFTEAAWRRTWRRWLFSFAALFGIALNLFQTWQAHGGGLDPEMMNRAYYWRIFFNTRVTDEDRLLLDSNERPFRRREAVQEVFFRDFETPGADSAQLSPEQAWSGTTALKVVPGTNSLLYSIPFDPEAEPRTNGVRLSGWFYGPKKEWDVWRMGQLHVVFARDGQAFRDKMIRVHRVMERRKWAEISADFHFPEKPFDEMRVYFYNPSEKRTVFIDDLKVEVFHGR